MTETPEKHCRPCHGEEGPLRPEQIQDHLSRLGGWTVNKEGTAIERTWIMKNFMAAVDFIHRVAELAEAEDHHPDIHLTGYRRLKIVLSTHAVKGLTENDFILAEKINALPAERKPES